MTVEDFGLTGHFWRDVITVAKETAAVVAIIALSWIIVLAIYALNE